MSAQIFELTNIHGVRVIGIASTSDTNVKVVMIECSPETHHGYGVPEARGQFSASELKVLAGVLNGYADAMLRSELKRDADIGNV